MNIKGTLKKIGIAIGLLALSFLLYLTIKEILRKEADLFFPETVDINNVTLHKKSEKISKTLAYYVFGIDTIKALILNIPEHIDNIREEKGENRIYAYIIKEPSNSNYFIFLSRKLPPVILMKTLAHEFIHIKQAEDRDLIMTLPGIGYTIWKGDTIKYDQIPYDERPYEIEAFNKEHETYLKLVEIYYE